MWKSQFTMDCDRLQEKKILARCWIEQENVDCKQFIPLPEDSDRTRCTLPPILRGHSGFAHTEAQSQEAQLGKREGED